MKQKAPVRHPARGFFFFAASPQCLLGRVHVSRFVLTNPEMNKHRRKFDARTRAASVYATPTTPLKKFTTYFHTK